MAVVEDESIEYDNNGRMKYHRDYHDRHGTQFTQNELVYLCKYYEHDHILDISFALGRTETTLRSTIVKLRKAGLYELYKTMDVSDEDE